MSKRTKESKKRISALVLLIAFTAILLITSIYAWFSTQKDVTITNLTGKVEVAETLEISLDAEEWGHEIDVSDANLAGANHKAWSATANVVPEYLIPASTTGTYTGTNAYNEGTLTLYRGESPTTKKLTNIAAVTESSTNADTTGYYAFDIFLRDTTNTEKTGYDASTATTLQLNSNSSCVISASGGNAGFGLENCVRVGFALMDATVPDTTIEKTDITDALCANTVKVKDVAIWEPYSNAHTTYIVRSNNKLNYTTINNTFAASTQFKTFAVNGQVTGSSSVIDNIYDWNQADTYGLSIQNTVQTTQTTAAGANYVKGQNKEGVQNLTSVNDTTARFKITPNKISRIRVYLWLEGQDVDCTNWATHGGSVTLNIGLIKEATVGTGSIS